jgi:hypothetical protein
MSDLRLSRLAPKAARELRANLDAACAGIAATAFIVAQIIKPTALCGDALNPSASFTVAAYVSVIGFLVASILCLAFRRLVGAKIAGLLIGLIVTVIALITLVLAASPTGLGLQEDSPEYASLQDALRDKAKPAVPANRRAYWLGASFRGADVSYVGRAGGHADDYASSDTTSYAPDELDAYPEVTYQAWDDRSRSVLEIAVMTYRDTAPAIQNYRPDQASVIVQTKSNQDVRVRFETPAKPDAALISEVRAALQVIPVDVTYKGCY